MLHSLIVNALIVKGNKILISQRGLNEGHDPGKWTIPGGKVDETNGDVWNILEFTLAKEVREEVDIEIDKELKLLTNNTFIRTGGQHVVAMIFLCYWKSGIAKPSEDTNDLAWVSLGDIDKYDFSPNVKKYLKKGFEVLANQT